MKPTTKQPTLFRETPKKPKLIGAPNGSFRSLASIYLPRQAKLPKKISEFEPEGTK